MLLRHAVIALVAVVPAAGPSAARRLLEGAEDHDNGVEIGSGEGRGLPGKTVIPRAANLLARGEMGLSSGRSSPWWPPQRRELEINFRVQPCGGLR
jgi:hypothetical protein